MPASQFLNRPLISDITLAILVTLWLLATANATFWAKGTTYFAPHPATLAALGIGLLALHVAGFVTVSVKYAIKPIYIFMILAAAATSWYADELGVIIDRDMIGNAATTTVNEAKHLVTPRFVLHMIVFGLLPSLAVIWVRIDHRTFGRKVIQHLAVIVPCLLIAGATTFWQYREFSSTFREHRDLMESLNPMAPVVAAVKYGKTFVVDDNVEVASLGLDATDAEPGSHGDKPHVLVLVVGETARAQNFSLFGYDRETNPSLKAHGNVFAFANTTSCGTATAVSLPCMFSVYNRDDYTESKAASTENVIDVLDHAGIHTEWWDNNTGSKGVALRTVERYFAIGDDPRFCVENECRDDILVDRLKQELPKVKGDTVFVLHQIGSHGPAYFMRYKEETAPFKPDCRSADFANCTDAELINAYDDTIAYTDKILGEIIDALSAHSGDIVGAMIYMSDHGESLGENGIYLHGAPWFIAPDEQTYVPFVAWLSPEHIKEEAVDTACLKAKGTGPYSHDNLFHSVLGVIEVSTQAYNRSLDVFAECSELDTAQLSPGGTSQAHN